MVLLQRGQTSVFHYESYHTAAGDSSIRFYQESTHEILGTDILLSLWPSEQNEQNATSETSCGTRSTADGINVGGSAVVVRFLQTETAAQLSVSQNTLYQHGHRDVVQENNQVGSAGKRPKPNSGGYDSIYNRHEGKDAQRGKTFTARDIHHLLFAG